MVRALLHEMTGDLSLAPAMPVSTDDSATADRPKTTTADANAMPRTAKKTAAPVSGQTYLKNVKVLLSNGDARMCPLTVSVIKVILLNN